MDNSPAHQMPTRSCAVASRRPGFWRRSWHLWALLGLTLIGGGLRFFWLERPPIWYDEAATFGRVAGDYQQMMNILLEQDGFMPLHYIVYWWLGKQTFLTPFMLRLIPALTGTLMIPAMYFLARQMTGRQVALLAAAFTMFSAYLLAFSRDAKMYMHTWFFVALSAGLLLWWMRSRKWWVWLIGWPLWVLTNATAVWLNANALFVLALQPLWILLGLRGPWWRIPLVIILFLGGLAAIAYGPYLYYEEYNKWHQRSGGVFSSTVFSDDRTNPDWSHSGINWIPSFHGDRNGPEIIRHSASSFILGWEWPNNYELNEKHPNQEYVIPRWTFELFSNVMILTALAVVLGALPWHRRLRGAISPRDPPAAPWWLAALWLGIWILLPTYSFYCRSVPAFASPRVITDFLAGMWGWWWLAMAVGIVGLVFLLAWSRGAVILLTSLLIGLGVVCLKLAFNTQGVSAWLPDWLGRLEHPWILGAFTLAGPALAFHNSGDHWKQRLIRSGQFLLVAGVLLALAWVTYLVWYDLWLLTQKKNPQWLWFLKVPDRPAQWMNLWWPRYLAVIWPAVAIALAMLIWRLPTWPLRWGVILILLAVNAGNGLARVVLDTDPPFPAITADLWAAQQSQSSLYVAAYEVDPQGRWTRSWPMDFMLRREEGRYYICLQTGMTPQPLQFRGNYVDMKLRGVPRVPLARLPAELSRRPQVQRVVVWLRYPPGPQPPPPELNSPDPALKLLGTPWRLESSHLQRVRQHWSRISREWNWQQREWIERREYVRTAAPTLVPEPSAVPPTQPSPGM